MSVIGNMGKVSVIRNTGSSYNGHFVRYRKPDIRNTKPAAYPITDIRNTKPAAYPITDMSVIRIQPCIL